jgi:hypothetical protein
LPPEWSRAFKSPAQNDGYSTEEYFLATTTDSAGNIYAATSFTGTETFGTTQFDSGSNAFETAIIKQTPTGSLIWARSFTNNGSGSSFPQAVAPAPGDGLYVSGNFTGTNWIGAQQIAESGGGGFYLARFNSNGDLAWIKAFSGTNFIFTSYHSIAADASGNVTISGLLQGPVNFGSTNVTGNGQYGVLVQYDSNGNFRWLQKPSGWSQTLVAQNERVYVAMSGNPTNYIGGLTNVSDRHYALASLDANDGHAIWLRNIGGDFNVGSPFNQADDIPLIAATATDVFVLGNAWGTSAIFGAYTVSWPGFNGQYFARFDLNGNAQLATSFGSESTYPWAAIADVNGNVYLAADFDGYSSFGNKILSAPHRDSIGAGYYSHGLVAKFDRDGNPLWARAATAQTNNVNFRGLALASDGIWVCGFAKAPANFGTNLVWSSTECIGTPFCTITWHNSGVLGKITDGIATALPVQIVNATKAGNNFQFSFVSQNGLSHTVESRTNLTLGTWQTRTNLTGDGTLKTVQFPTGSSMTEFFRVTIP